MGCSMYKSSSDKTVALTEEEPYVLIADILETIEDELMTIW